MREYGVRWTQRQMVCERAFQTREGQDAHLARLAQRGVVGRRIEREVGHWIGVASLDPADPTTLVFHEDDPPFDQQYVVRYRRAGNPTNNTQARYFPNSDAAEDFINMKLLVDGAAFSDLRIDRRRVDNWVEIL